jgi:hypothetical protein
MTSRSTRLALTALLAVAFLGTASPALAAPPVASPVPAPAVVEGFAPYVGQVSCDPTPKPGAVAFATLVFNHYKVGRNGGIERDCAVGGTSEHKEGRAWDWMLNAADPVQKATADEFLEWLTAPGPDQKLGYNARRLGVMYVIWNAQTWSAYRADQGWLPYTGASPHTDHIHVSLSWSGAMKRTSFWTGQAAPHDYGPCRQAPTFRPRSTRARGPRRARASPPHRCRRRRRRAPAGRRRPATPTCPRPRSPGSPSTAQRPGRSCSASGPAPTTRPAP